MLRDTARDNPAMADAALTGLRRYQAAPRRPTAERMPVIALKGRAKIRDYGGTRPMVVFVPSLINPPDILDLTPERSLLRWMAEQGFAIRLVDWGDAGQEHRDLDIGSHVELLSALLHEAGRPLHLVGYCLGGTMALAAACLVKPASLTLIATPWHFEGYGDAARDELAHLWLAAEPVAERLGVLPTEVMQSAFWRLDPKRTIAKFAQFAALDPASEEAALFIAMEDWSNSGAPLPYASAREAFEQLFARDVTGKGLWHVDGRRIDLTDIECPILDIVSTTDRIVPAASASGASNVLRVSQGHVGMIVGGQARAKLWQPLADWITECEKS